MLFWGPASSKSIFKGQGSWDSVGGEELSKGGQRRSSRVRRECLEERGVWGQRLGGFREARHAAQACHQHWPRIPYGLGRFGFSPRC